jgi:2-dehydro-3-deoxyphosphogluconate aldolase/(4S)-4-hydroxy-2-oxoglutarate aldolase
LPLERKGLGAMALQTQVLNNKRIENWLRRDHWLPLISGENVTDAFILVQAILSQKPDQKLIEVGLRNPNALATLDDIKTQMPELLCGGGTVLTVSDLRALADVGADFAVSPGFQPELAKLAIELDIAYLPGVMTPSDVMTALQFGYRCLKFFPAKAAGGVNMLRALAGPFSRACFCPTGGVAENEKSEYLELNNVVAVGGSVR